MVLKHYISPAIKPSSNEVPHTTVPIPPYFWGEDESHNEPQPRLRGYSESREIVGGGTLGVFDRLTTEAIKYLKEVYEDVEAVGTANKTAESRMVTLHLSNELLQWKAEQQKDGRVLPGKGEGLKRAPLEVINLLGAEDWPEPLLASNTLIGPGWANMLIGAYDSPTLYSNYCVDTGFYYEHGFDKVYPQFETMIKEASNDERAMKTPLGKERRAAANFGLRYIRGKVDFETQHFEHLTNKTAKIDRRTAQIVFLSEGSLNGMGCEAIGRGFDPAGVMNDLVLSGPGTDVVDVGSDLGNSEVLNSLLTTADITDSGVVTEDALRRVYDAYAHAFARVLTERWHEPLARMLGQLYVWHMVNDRHRFARRALLGYAKVHDGNYMPKGGGQQREGDFDEVFDESFHTTGFSRPLACACDGDETCNRVLQLFDCASYSSDIRDRLKRLWHYLSIAPLQYVVAGVVDAEHEEELSCTLQLELANAYHMGLVEESAWLVCHASQHAWQVNFLFKAAMFGSLLDDGSLVGKLDRAS
ncbi:hypothetical protein PG989_011833 [Apiospora arundinis]